MKMLPRVMFLFLLPLLAISCGKKAEQASTSETPEPESAPPAASYAHVSSAMLKSWMIGLVNRQPSPNAESAITLGDAGMEVRAPENSKAWAETADVDSNGVSEKITFMWDGESRTMYAYTTDPVALADGTMAAKGLMIAQFGENNTRGRAPGSGWYAYALSRDTTGVEQATGTLFGCAFDRHGTEEKCGTGTWSRDQNEFQMSIDKP